MKKLMLLFCLLFVIGIACASHETLLGYQCRVTNSTNSSITSGNFTLNISSTNSCDGSIFSKIYYDNFTSNGIIDVMVGEGSDTISLDYNSDYYLCPFVQNSSTAWEQVGGPYIFRGGQGEIGIEDVSFDAGNATANQTLWDSLYCLLTGCTYTGNVTGLNFNGTDFTLMGPHEHEISLKDTGHWTLHIVDDTMIHHTNLTITASGGVVTADLDNEQYPGHNIAYVVNETKYTITEGSGDDTVTLTAGTWVSPQTNYIWVDCDGVLEASTTSPTGEFAWAGIVEVANATGSIVHYYAVQDEVPVLYELITNTYERAWWSKPIYETGIAISIGAGAFATTEGTIRFASTSVPYEARNTSTGTKFMWADDPNSAYTLYDNLTTIDNYQDGGAIGVNKYFKFMVYGLTEDNGNDYYYITVQDEPSAECTSISCAESDVEHKMNYQFPDRFKKTGFRIAEIVLKHEVGGNVPQTQSNGLLYKQLLDESLIVLGGTSGIALGLDEVLENNPNTDNNIVSTANITADVLNGTSFIAGISTNRIKFANGLFYWDVAGNGFSDIYMNEINNVWNLFVRRVGANNNYTSMFLHPEDGFRLAFGSDTDAVIYSSTNDLDLGTSTYPLGNVTSDRVYSVQDEWCNSTNCYTVENFLEDLYWYDIVIGGIDYIQTNNNVSIKQNNLRIGNYIGRRGSLYLHDGQLKYLEITVPSLPIGGSWKLTLPSVNGNPNEALITDGEGVTSWSPVAVQGQGENVNVTMFSSNHNVEDIDRIFLCNATNNAINFSLPRGSLGKMFTMKKIDASSNACSFWVSVADGDKLDGYDNYTITTRWESVEIVGHTDDWYVV